MKVPKEFYPDNPAFIFVLGAILVSLSFLFAFQVLGTLLYFFTSVFVFWIFFLHYRNFKIDIDEKGVKGPGFYAPIYRVFIPWEEAEVHFDQTDQHIHCIIVKHKHSKRRIRLPRFNFSQGMLRVIHYSIQHHHPADLIEKD